MTDPVLEGSKTLSLTLSFGPDPCPDPWWYILTSLWGRLGRRRKSKWRLGGLHFISMPSSGWFGHKKTQRRSNRILYNQITWRCYGFKCHKGDFNDWRDLLLFTIIPIEWDDWTYDHKYSKFRVTWNDWDSRTHRDWPSLAGHCCHCNIAAQNTTITPLTSLVFRIISSPGHQLNCKDDFRLWLTGTERETIVSLLPFPLTN